MFAPHRLDNARLPLTDRYSVPQVGAENEREMSVVLRAGQQGLLLLLLPVALNEFRKHLERYSKPIVSILRRPKNAARFYANMSYNFLFGINDLMIFEFSGAK